MNELSMMPDGTLNEEYIAGLNLGASATPEELSVEVTRLKVVYAQSLVNSESLEYLKSTDWYITRHAETGVAVPADVTTLRAAAREAIV